MEEELVEADISRCAGYTKFLSPYPLEAILIKYFKMSFQIGNNSDKLDESIARMLLKKDTYTMADIFSVVNQARYYKCIKAMNDTIEIAILKALKNVDIAGVEFVKMEARDKKLYATYRVLR